MRTDGPAATRGERFQESQRVEVDLREPPTREEAGLAPGRETLVVERGPGGMLATSFPLPNGKTLSVPAVGVIFTAAPGAGDGAPVESLTVNRSEPDLAAARAALLADAATLGLDAAEVESYFADVRPGERVARVFRAAPLGYLRVEVEVRHDPGAGAYADLGYKLDWGSMLR